jgi:hypothetical protein
LGAIITAAQRALPGHYAGGAVSGLCPIRHEARAKRATPEYLDIPIQKRMRMAPVRIIDPARLQFPKAMKDRMTLLAPSTGRLLNY